MLSTRPLELRLASAGLPAWAVNIALAAAVGMVYFLAVQLAFGLLTTNKVAVFWPASGVAAGALIVLGPRARWAVVTGVMTAVLVGHLITAKPLPAGIVSAIADGVEVWVIAGLIQHYYGRTFTLNHPRHVIGLVAAGIAGVSVSAIGGIIATRLQVNPPVEPVLTSFIDWVTSNTIGVIVVAPFIIELDAAIRNPPPLREILEGAAGLVVLAGVTALIILLPEQIWGVFVPIVWLIPVFTYIAGRCRPGFVAAGVFIVCMTVVWTVIFGIGHFGRADVSIGHRILEAQVLIFFVTLGALLLAALFAERRENEEKLAKSNRLLERERDNKLMSLQAALASISHEIQQPLSAIATNGAAAQHLLELVPPDLGAARMALIDVQHASTSTRNILDNLRLLFGKGEREKEWVDVNELARGALELLQKNVAENRVNATLELTSDLPSLLCHRGQLIEVFLNLVQNAIESMGSVERGARTLNIRTKRDGYSAILIEVQDSGVGIEPARLERIFEAFVTTKATGIGLGLAICKEIVERHDGRLVASSNAEGGALFQVFLPIKPQDGTANG